MKIDVKGQMDVAEMMLLELPIGTLKTSMAITTTGITGNGIILAFGCGCEIHIDERGIFLSREVRRPNHDHDDHEELCHDPANPGRGVFWGESDFSPKGTVRRFYIEFGAVTVGY